MPGRNNKREVWSLSDVVNDKSDSGSQSRPKFKSGYSGPKKPGSGRSSNNAAIEGASSAMPSRRNSEEARRAASSRSRSSENEDMDRGQSSVRSYAAGGNGIFDYAWIPFSAVLAICLLLSVIMYNVNGKDKDKYSYPSYIFTFNGVLNAIYDDYNNGGLGTAYRYDQMNKPEDENVDKDALLGGTTNSSTLPNTTTGATMNLDTGSTYGSYAVATSHAELIDQLRTALESNDFGFVGMKLSYQDETTGDLIGYPQSVVEHFTNYMSNETGKREVFLSEISDEATYGVKNGGAYLIKLPILKFTINMGYDNTTVSVSGFSDQKMDAGQSAVVSPLLPCMYDITVTTDGGSQSSQVECDMAEGNLQVNIGVTN